MLAFRFQPERDPPVDSSLCSYKFSYLSVVHHGHLGSLRSKGGQTS